VEVKTLAEIARNLPKNRRIYKWPPGTAEKVQRAKRVRKAGLKMVYPLLPSQCGELLMPWTTG
jgi:hypothetical protein